MKLQEVSEIIVYLSSGSWSDRREGLHALQRSLKTDVQLRSFLYYYCYCSLLPTFSELCFLFVFFPVIMLLNQC